jgi:hypothetical protein
MKSVLWIKNIFLPLLVSNLMGINPTICILVSQYMALQDQRESVIMNKIYIIVISKYSTNSHLGSSFISKKTNEHLTINLQLFQQPLNLISSHAIVQREIFIGDSWQTKHKKIILLRQT